jgi:succinate dehydrogenase/fumarate reductase flavoprotein subunit
VLDANDQAIDGLYAVGTDMASVMGGFYPSGGINLGPAMTFGYIAGRHAARATGYESEESGSSANVGSATAAASTRAPVAAH